MEYLVYDSDTNELLDVIDLNTQKEINSYLKANPGSRLEESFNLDDDYDVIFEDAEDDEDPYFDDSED